MVIRAASLAFTVFGLLAGASLADDGPLICEFGPSLGEIVGPGLARLSCQATDDILVKDVILNRGNCEIYYGMANNQWVFFTEPELTASREANNGGLGKLSFGEVLKIWTPITCDLIEARIEMGTGVQIVTFKP